MVTGRFGYCACAGAKPISSNSADKTNCRKRCIAIPHGKLPKLEKLVGLFARLERPIDFESLDGQPVDLVFLLLAPEGAGADHLKALARVARLLREAEVVTRLRETRDADALYAVLAAPSSEAA